MTHITVLVPFSRPQNRQVVLANFTRQTHPAKSLLIVENGRGLGAWQGPGTVLRAPHAHTAGAAKNAGMQYLRKQGAQYVSVMDDDDYYSPGYLTEQAAHLPYHPIVGKNQHFLHDHKGMWLLNRYVHSRPFHWCSGGVQSFDLGKVGNFRDQSLHEDVQFVHDVLDRGGHLYVTSPYGYLWNRTGGDHTFTEDVVQRARLWGLHTIFLGPLNLAIVDGKVPLP